MPRLGAPQAQGPGSAAADLAEGPETAKTESSCFTLPLSHFLQDTAVEDEATIFSNLVPQSLHWYSKMGIGGFARSFCDDSNISKSKIAFKSAVYVSLVTGMKCWSEPHFMRVGVNCHEGITLDSPMVID